jgi:uncharacterized protein (DUF4415 family)
MAKKRSASSARAARTAPSAQRTGRWRKKIDYSDIPASTPEQLAAFRRIGRPPIGDEPRRLIAIRLDARVLAAYQKEAKRRGIGYQTLMHEVLAKHAALVA